MQTAFVLMTLELSDSDCKGLVLVIAGRVRTLSAHNTCTIAETGVESRKGAVPESYCMPTRFPSPLIKPDVPVSSIRLSDRLHQLAHGSGPRCTSRSRRTPNFPNTIAFEKLVAPRDDTL